jgi:tripartite ATP-independent transporter DctM subunit
MEWWLILILIFGGFLLLLAAGVPVAFSFLFLDAIAICILWSPTSGLRQLVLSVNASVSSFSFLPIPMFVLMGDIMYQSGVAPKMIDTMDKWLGRTPGRLALLTVGAGTLFATLSGSSMASTAMLGTTLIPDMKKKGYKYPMILGPVMGSGSLAMMIPPSGLGVLTAALGGFSVGDLLLGITIPGFMLGAIFSTYIIIRCWIQPSLAMAYEVKKVPISVKLVMGLKYIIPVGFIIFLVIGIMVLGIGTPNEAAVFGVLGSFIVAFFYGNLSSKIIRSCFLSTLRITGMIFMIITGSKAFSQILAYTQATSEIPKLVTLMQLHPLPLLILVIIVLIILGCFLDQTSILMITFPIFIPLAQVAHFNLVWFGVIVMITLEIATLSPPFGLGLFVMKSIAPPDVTMQDVYLSVLPFIFFDLLAIAMIIVFPGIALWLPSISH